MSEAIRALSRVHMASGKKEDKIFIIFSNLPGFSENTFQQGNRIWQDRLANLPEQPEVIFILMRTDLF